MAEFDALQIRKVDGGLLLIFRELLLRRRATQVAGQLGLSPSAISHALTRLRDLFGDPLFIRRSHGLEPTQRAIELGPQVDALIAMAGAAISRDQGFDPAESRRRFRILCPDYIATLLAGPLVAAFRDEVPHGSFSTWPAFLGRALRAIRRGEAEVAIGAFDQLPRGCVARPLYEDEYWVIARRGHPTVQGQVDLRTYARTSHVFVGQPDGALADEWADREGMRDSYGDLPPPGLVKTHAYFTQWETGMLLVSGSDVLADCPRRLAEAFADRLGLQVMPPPFEPFRFAVQAVRRADSSDAGVDWLVDRIAQALA